MFSTPICYFQFGPGQEQPKFWPVFAFTRKTGMRWVWVWLVGWVLLGFFFGGGGGITLQMAIS